MKQYLNRVLFVLTIPLLLSVLFACSGFGSASSCSDESTATFVIKKEYSLIPDSCSVQWERYLHQKPTKQNIQLFGANVEAELGEIEMTTSGTALVHTGKLIVEGDQPVSANILFDMESFKLAAEKGNGLFDVIKYPDCELNILSFDQKEGKYIVNAQLEIQDSIRQNVFDVNIKNSLNTFELSGRFQVNTLDYPLRTKVKASDIYKDVITIQFKLLFEMVSEKKALPKEKQ